MPTRSAVRLVCIVGAVLSVLMAIIGLVAWYRFGFWIAVLNGIRDYLVLVSLGIATLVGFLWIKSRSEDSDKNRSCR
jgi:hypothetical protein